MISQLFHTVLLCLLWYKRWLQGCCRLLLWYSSWLFWCFYDIPHGSWCVAWFFPCATLMIKFHVCSSYGLACTKSSLWTNDLFQLLCSYCNSDISHKHPVPICDLILCWILFLHQKLQWYNFFYRIIWPWRTVSWLSQANLIMHTKNL